MRKLMSKKGFTLVELMIVVVILGILVAVAVPIFSSVTKNARIKSCKSNQRVIKGNLETIVTTGDNGDAIPISATINFKADDCSYKASFLALFDGGALPKCPKAASTAEANSCYNASATYASGVIGYDAACAVQAGIDEGHND